MLCMLQSSHQANVNKTRIAEGMKFAIPEPALMPALSSIVPPMPTVEQLCMPLNVLATLAILEMEDSPVPRVSSPHLCLFFT